MGECQQVPSPDGRSRRDPGLALFASGGSLDRARPSARVFGALESLSGSPGPAGPSGPDGSRFAGATLDEAAGMLAEAQAMEGHVSWMKLALVAEVIRHHGPEVPGGGLPRPEEWDRILAHEVAAILHVSWQAAEPLLDLAWQLGTRLRGVDGLLNAGVLSQFTAKIIADEFSLLDDGKAAEAERELLEHDLGADDMTPGAIRRLCQRIAITVDPEGAEARRKEKERGRVRLDFYRESGGGMGLYGTGLPTDQALLSDANIRARVREYQDAGITERADFLRAQAGLDLTNGVSVPERVATWRAQQAEDGEGPDGGSGDAPRGQHGPEYHRGPALPAIVNLTAPLSTILGQAARPGEAPAFGALDPELTRQLADAAARDPRSEFCVTFTDCDGHAVAHGCARLIRNKNPGPPEKSSGKARERERDGPLSGNSWAFTRDPARDGPENGYGDWILRLPTGARYRVAVHAVPLRDCDHSLATDAYQPGRLLRHLTEIRDGECTSPSCSHPARLCDFEHAVPHHAGGPTCACNAGMRSRRCHQVKQSPGVEVSQPLPGWHRWRMPSGRSYTKRPKRYPV